VYIPLTKNKMSVVTLTNNNPEAKYGWSGGGSVSGRTRRKSHRYGNDRKVVWRKTSESRNTIIASNCNKNTALQSGLHASPMCFFATNADSGTSSAVDSMHSF
jgi:hypothetical protein